MLHASDHNPSFPIALVRAGLDRWLCARIRYSHIPIDKIEISSTARTLQAREERVRMEDALEQSASPRPNSEEARVLQAVLESIRRIKHGSVQIVVQDSVVVQIDTVEKKRFRAGQAHNKG